ncbi:sugar kinase [Kitasatospora sp. NE20-6]|uniref:ROK family transcriptional regulator n=1 Tax=Kitasatospora sp. NE20-6 TaxID=2859066 RepID=UPI0034DBC37C
MDGLLTPAHHVPRLRRTDIPAAGSRRASSAGTVLRAVLDHGPVARSTVARLTGLSPASVTVQCTQLIAGGLVREAPEAAGPKSVGRPHVPVDIDTGRHLVCGVHIAVSHTTLALLDLRGRIIAEDRQPLAGSRPSEALRRMADRLPGLLAGHGGGRPLLGLGVATGGRVDSDSGVITEHPLLGWRDVPARELLATATGLPVYVDGHARALVRAEQLFGEARSRASVVQLFVGNVVDAAFATSGAVHHGPRFAAGTVAHLPVEESRERCSCGRIGCLQAAVSEQTIVRRAVEQGVITTPSMADLLTAAQGGNAGAVEMFRERARLVGRAAALLLDVLDPEVLVVVEPGASRLPQCLAELRAEVKARSWVCEDPERTVLTSSFASGVLPTAGGAVVLDPLYADPTGMSPRLSEVS